jgi:acyl-CoA synthetase (AMP-forming)/AMP-acid ligase II
VLTTYGMTETGSGVASGGADQATLDDPRAGRPLPGVQLRIEPDSAAHGGGQILVRGDMVFSGYIDDAQATAATLRDGWLHTGDIGSLDEDGLLRVLDRRHDLIISGGENISPAEVEAVLAEHPGIREATVIGEADLRWGAVPVAYVVAAAEPGPDDAELVRHCGERLARYKVPVRFVHLATLPRNAMGKVVHDALPGLAPEVAS